MIDGVSTEHSARLTLWPLLPDRAKSRDGKAEPPAAGEGAMAGNRFFHVNVNVTDLDRSIAFYRLFGFEVVFRQALDPETSRRTALAFGRERNDAEYALMRIGDDPRATCLDLVQWKT